jgi:hypothetical protein
MRAHVAPSGAGVARPDLLTVRKTGTPTENLMARLSSNPQKHHPQLQKKHQRRPATM